MTVDDLGVFRYRGLVTDRNDLAVSDDDGLIAQHAIAIHWHDIDVHESGRLIAVRERRRTPATNHRDAEQKIP